MKKHLFLMVLFLVELNLNASGQAKPTRIYLQYFKNSDNSKSVIVSLKYREKNYVPLSNAEIEFYGVSDTSRMLITRARTGGTGDVVFNIDDLPVPQQIDGALNYEAVYAGDENYKSVQGTVLIRDAVIEISFFQKDQNKLIEVFVGELVGDEIIPLNEVYVLFYVRGSFSLLNIGEEETDNEGKARLEFPEDIPGDLAGELTIVARVEEHDEFGTIEDVGMMNWGTPIEPVVEKHRGLGDTDAPLWMVYTLIILLSAVWFHYMYVIVLIIKIKLEEKNIQIQKLLGKETR